MVRQRFTLTSFTKEEIHSQIIFLCLISDALFSENELWPAWSFVTYYAVAVLCGDGGLVFSLICLCQTLKLNLCFERTQDCSNKF